MLYRGVGRGLALGRSISRLSVAWLRISLLRGSLLDWSRVLYWRALAVRLVLVVVSASEELDVVANDFGLIVLLSVLSVPTAGGQASFDINLASFPDEFLAKVGEPSPCDDVVPLGVLSELSVTVTESLCGGEAEGRYFRYYLVLALILVWCLILEVTYFRVCADVTD